MNGGITSLGALLFEHNAQRHCLPPIYRRATIIHCRTPSHQSVAITFSQARLWRRRQLLPLTATVVVAGPPPPTAVVVVIVDRCRRPPPLGSGRARVQNLGGEEVLIPVVKFIQSTYEGPSYKFLGDGTDWKSGSKKERPRGRPTIPHLLNLWYAFWLWNWMAGTEIKWQSP